MDYFVNDHSQGIWNSMYSLQQSHRFVRFGLCVCLLFIVGCKQQANSTTSTEILDEPRTLVPAKSEPAPLAGLPPGLEAFVLPTRPSRDGTRFESLSVESTGIDFAHHWTPPPGYKLEIYRESLPGGGACVGDYDGDGWPDVFLTQPYVGSRLYRNLGAFRFEDVTESTVGDIPYALGATFVDIDNDGDLDLSICNNEHANQLLVNDGKGHFKDHAAEFGLAFSGSSIMMSFADYDQDGDLDAYLVTNRKDPDFRVPQPQRGPDGTFQILPEHREYVDAIERSDGKAQIINAAQYDHLYRNNGDGTFSDVSQLAGIGGNYYGLAATWWDYNRDGWADIYVANDFYGPDQLYRNNGDGTFTDVAPTSFPHTPWYSMGCDVADINNDGWLDLMGSDMSGSSHYTQKASMGNMSSNAWFLVHPTPRQYARNALYLNTGTDRFMEIAQLAGVADTDWTWSLKFADLDEDGWSDLYVTNGVYRDWTNTDLRNRSDQAKTQQEKIQIWLDSPQKRDANLAFRNTGDYRFERVSTAWGLGAEQVSSGAAMSDLDRDGDLDIVVNNAKEAPSIYRNNTTGTHRVIIRLQGVSSNRFGIGATVSLNSIPIDAASHGGTSTSLQVRYVTSGQGYMSSNEPIVHFGLGDSEVIQRLEVRWPNGGVQTFENLPADHCYTITEPEARSLGTLAKSSKLFRESRLRAELHRETPFDDFVRQPLLPNQLSQLGPGMACADVDGDGDTDIFLAGAAGQAGQLLINEEDGFYLQFGGPWQGDAKYEDTGLVFLDTDGDGDSDLYVVSGGVECDPDDALLQDRLYINNGQGEFTQAPAGVLPESRISGSAVAADDFDRDGDLDLFVGGRVIPGQYPLTPNSQLLRNESGRFVEVAPEVAHGLQQTGLVTSALWSDVDNDGWRDLLVTHEWGPLKLYLNEHGHLVEQTMEAGLESKSGWYNSIAAADLDRDGDMDFVVGNLGWNMKYHASSEKPALLYYGDFEKNGRMRLVEAEYENETLFPMRGKSCSTNAMPFLGDKFEKFHDFAVASLQDIYTPTRLESSHRFSANSLETGAWINDGTGKFVFQPFPTLAQSAPTFGIVIGDFTDDDAPDVILAQNFYGPQAETGRADGSVGMLLAGNGDGTFTPIPAHESGIVVPADAKATVLADIGGDGNAEILVATNNGPVYVFEQTRATVGQVVRLLGQNANPQAIGARVIAHYSNGTTKMAEVSCGGGYLSQSTSDLFFSLSLGATLQRLDVTWPMGEKTSHQTAGENGTIVISQ